MKTNRRRFLKLSAAAAAGAAVSHLPGCASRKSNSSGSFVESKLTNWAGNYRYSTGKIYRANSLEQVCSFVKQHRRFKVLGTRHCFNGIADSPDDFLSLREMNRVVALGPKARTVTVEAGMSYGQLGPYLHEKGFALHNLASLPHVSIAGACATATQCCVQRLAFINPSGPGELGFASASRVSSTAPSTSSTVWPDPAPIAVQTRGSIPPEKSSEMDCCCGCDDAGRGEFATSGTTTTITIATAIAARASGRDSLGKAGA